MPIPRKVPKFLMSQIKIPGVGSPWTWPSAFCCPFSNLTEAGPQKLVISLFVNLRPRRNYIEALNIYLKELLEES